MTFLTSVVPQMNHGSIGNIPNTIHLACTGTFGIVCHLLEGRAHGRIARCDQFPFYGDPQKLSRFDVRVRFEILPSNQIIPIIHMKD